MPKTDKLTDLNNVLISAENELLRRAADQKDDEIERIVNFVNDLAASGEVDIRACGGADPCGDEDGAASDDPS